MINLAEYADALKPFAVILPLQGCDLGAILHVCTIRHLLSISHFPIKRSTSFLKLRDWFLIILFLIFRSLYSC